MVADARAAERYHDPLAAGAGGRRPRARAPHRRRRARPPRPSRSTAPCCISSPAGGPSRRPRGRARGRLHRRPRGLRRLHVHAGGAVRPGAHDAHRAGRRGDRREDRREPPRRQEPRRDLLAAASGARATWTPWRRSRTGTSARGSPRSRSTALTLDPELLASSRPTPGPSSRVTRRRWRALVARCARAKALTVAEDERDAGARLVLNYGHTLGHALERLEAFGGRSHGEAIAVGMVFAARLAQARGHRGGRPASRGPFASCTSLGLDDGRAASARGRHPCGVPAGQEVPRGRALRAARGRGAPGRGARRAAERACGASWRRWEPRDEGVVPVRAEPGRAGPPRSAGLRRQRRCDEVMADVVAKGFRPRP